MNSERALVWEVRGAYDSPDVGEVFFTLAQSGTEEEARKRFAASCGFDLPEGATFLPVRGHFLQVQPRPGRLLTLPVPAGTDEDDRETLRYATAAYGFLLFDDRVTNWAQFADRIRRNYDGAREPRTAAILRAIRRAVVAQANQGEPCASI